MWREKKTKWKRKLTNKKDYATNMKRNWAKPKWGRPSMVFMRPRLVILHWQRRVDVSYNGSFLWQNGVFSMGTLYSNVCGD
jgi:hypothetical protein